MGRKKRADYERGLACAQVIRDNLDLYSPEWSIDDLEEWAALDAIADRIELIMRYNSALQTEGGVVSAWTFFEAVKGLKYSPALLRMYNRHKETMQFRDAMCHRPLPNVVTCPLLEGVYKLALNQRRRRAATAGGKFKKAPFCVPHAGNEIAEGKSSRKGAAGGTRRREKPCNQGKVKGAARETGHK